MWRRRSARDASPGSWVTTIHRAPALCDVAEQREHLVGRGGVQIAGRLIGDDDVGVVGQRPRDRDALALASGQLMRAFVDLLGEAQRVSSDMLLARISSIGSRSNVRIGSMTFLDRGGIREAGNETGTRSRIFSRRKSAFRVSESARVGWPQRMISPSVGASRRPIRYSNDDFPDPDGP